LADQFYPELCLFMGSRHARPLAPFRSSEASNVYTTSWSCPY
jgi:hypothetical protein